MALFLVALGASERSARVAAFGAAERGAEAGLDAVACTAAGAFGAGERGRLGRGLGASDRAVFPAAEGGELRSLQQARSSRSNAAPSLQRRRGSTSRQPALRLVHAADSCGATSSSGCARACPARSGNSPDSIR